VLLGDANSTVPKPQSRQSTRLWYGSSHNTVVRAIIAPVPCQCPHRVLFFPRRCFHGDVWTIRVPQPRARSVLFWLCPVQSVKFCKIVQSGVPQFASLLLTGQSERANRQCRTTTLPGCWRRRKGNGRQARGKGGTTVLYTTQTDMHISRGQEIQIELRHMYIASDYDRWRAREELCKSGQIVAPP
jgi:hypothetical protein